MRAAEIEGQRRAEARLVALDDLGVGSGLKLGMDYVRGKKDPPPDRDAGHHTFKTYYTRLDDLRKQAYPWVFDKPTPVPAETPEEREARLDREQDLAFRSMFQALQA